MTYDAIIVGARCAGSPTAMLLARKGYRVLLLDRASFPSDTLSTHFIHQPGVARLKCWGLLEQVIASNCPPIPTLSLDVGYLTLEGSKSPMEEAPDAYSPRRRVLDQLLVDAAGPAGAGVREGCQAQELRGDGGRVVGIRGLARDGAKVAERARIVIGADGMRSFIARSVRAPTYKTRPTLACMYYSYWSDVSLNVAGIWLRHGLIAAAWPTNDDLTLVVLEWPRREFDRVRADVEGNFERTVEKLPGLVDRLRAGRRVERICGTADLPSFFRRPYGPGWALVGDAGYHRDPATGQGITDALRDAELLAEALDAGFAGRQRMEAALAGYERQRNRAVVWMYRLTNRVATRQFPPGGKPLLEALRGDQQETDRLFGTLIGTVSIPEFFSPLNLLRLIGKHYLSKSKTCPASLAGNG